MKSKLLLIAFVVIIITSCTELDIPDMKTTIVTIDELNMYHSDGDNLIIISSGSDLFYMDYSDLNYNVLDDAYNNSRTINIRHYKDYDLLPYLDRSAYKIIAYYIEN
jgi:hypothetical protein